MEYTVTRFTNFRWFNVRYFKHLTLNHRKYGGRSTIPGLWQLEGHVQHSEVTYVSCTAASVHIEIISMISGELNDGCVHYIMVSKTQWKPF